MKGGRAVVGLIGPAAILYAVFGIAPLFMVVIGTVWDGGAYGEGWIGFEAFRSVFSNGRFFEALRTSLLFVAVLLPVALLCITVVSIVIGWARPRAAKFIRAAYYIPTVSSAMMIAFVWRALMRPGGYLNELMGNQVNYLAEGLWPFITIGLATLPTTFGASIIILSAALASIDDELYEAARLDGCGPIKEALYVTVPLVSPVLLYIGVTTMVALVQLWQYPYGITGGGPNYKTTTALLLIYQRGFVAGNLPEATVMSLVVIFQLILLMIVYKKATKQEFFA